MTYTNTDTMANEKEFSIDLKQEVARGSYSNLAIITHSHSEFVIDFARVLPGMPKPDISDNRDDSGACEEIA